MLSELGSLVGKFVLIKRIVLGLEAALVVGLARTEEAIDSQTLYSRQVNVQWRQWKIGRVKNFAV